MENYRIYFNTKMLDDALLKQYVTPRIIRDSSSYVESIAQSYGITPEQIAEPTPFLVSQLGMFWAYMTAAWGKSQFSLGKSVDNDSFALKYKLFKELLDDLLKQLSAETFTNGKKAKKRTFPAVMSISRN